MAGALRKEITQIKGILTVMSGEKEKIFRSKSEMDRAITELIRKVKRLKAERDELTAKVRAAKEERSVVSREIKEKIGQFTEAKKKAETIIGKHKIMSPGMLEKEITALEYKIETEALPFDKEQKLTKLIKQKQRELELARQAMVLHSGKKDISNTIDGLKKKSDELSRAIQENAAESQRRHEEMVGASGKIDELKRERDGLQQKFAEQKTHVRETSGRLKEKLAAFNEENVRLAERREREEAERKERAEQILKDKEGEVEEKLKKGKKLTAEDLLVFQKN